MAYACTEALMKMKQEQLLFVETVFQKTWPLLYLMLISLCTMNYNRTVTHLQDLVKKGDQVKLFPW